jgi:hypothetical protein
MAAGTIGGAVGGVQNDGNSSDSRGIRAYGKSTKVTLKVKKKKKRHRRKR